MCTLTLAWQVVGDAPVLVAANRDEAFDRPASAPARRDWERPAVAPRDESAGGTWIGYNDAGLLVAITNRWVPEQPAADRSRGRLVRDALACESAEAATRFVERELDERSYAGFNLVLADARAALLVEWDGRRAVRHLDPGIHVVVNVGADGRYRIPAHRPEVGESQADNADALRTVLQPEPGEPGAAWLDRAGRIIADHEYGVCIHGDGFGTTSSSLIALYDDEATYAFADGPPCETESEPVEATVTLGSP